jgi:hypothetical protein
MKDPRLRALGAGSALLIVLGLGGTAGADVFIPAAARVTGAIGSRGLQGFFYDRNDPPGVINSLAVADAIIAGSTPTARFSARMVDYPSGPGDISFLPTLGALLGVDAGTLKPSDAVAIGASPTVMRLEGVIHITEDLDIAPGNSTIDVRFALGSDDGSRLRIGGETVISIDGTDVFFAFPPQQIAVASFEAPGLYPVELVWYDHFGGVGIEWYSSIPGGPASGGPAGTAGIVPAAVLGVLGCGGARLCECGDTLVESRTLVCGVDPVTVRTCDGDGLIVNGLDGDPAPNITLDLGGCTIRGNDDTGTAGIHVGFYGGLTVTSGRITGFGSGILAEETFGSRFTNLQLPDNRRSGIVLGESNGNLVAQSNISRMECAAAGILVNGGDNEILLNRIEFNTFDGTSPGAITVSRDLGEPGANTIARNVVRDNGTCGPPVAGVAVSDNGAAIDLNRSEYNTGAGFLIAGADPDDAGMTVVRNIARANGHSGFTVAATGSRFDRNRADYNRRFGIEDTTHGGGTSGTASVYVNNGCTGNVLGRSSPPGLCR